VESSRRRHCVQGVAVAAALVAAIALFAFLPDSHRASRARSAAVEVASSPPTPSTASSPESNVVSEAPGTGDLARWGIPAASLGPRPESLRGTEVDGALRTDADGRFLPGPETIRLFDYFFSASGEEPDDVIRGRIALHVLEHLPPDAAAEAIAVLDRYLSFRRAARELAASERVPGDLERRWQWVRELRREHFGPELEAALYGEEEARTLVDLERREVLRDQSLSREEREQRLAALEERLPERVRAARRRAEAPLRVRREVERLRESGASEAEVFAARQRAFGAAAAERLAALDRRRADWQERLAAYRSERDALLADPDLSAQEREAALETLRRSTFAAEELARVRALDAAGL
jgi:lipase chaperone LimK